MSFKFTWPEFSPEFHQDARSMLNSALNRGPKPKVIADDIKVAELSMGSVPPDLEILEIGDLSKDRFRGIFRLTYSGDAHIVLSTKVQANPLSKASPGANGSNGAANASNSLDGETFAPFSTGSATRGILFAATPLVVPMQLRLSHVRLRAIIVLVVSKTKGITLVFKNDPLESVQVSSTFDSVAVIAKYLQQEIEAQLKEVFREDLPGIIHRLSQGWLNGQRSAKKSQSATPSASSSSQQPPKSPTPRSPKPKAAAAPSLAASPPARPPSTTGSRKSTRKSTGGRKSADTPASKDTQSEYLPPLSIPPRIEDEDDQETSLDNPMPYSTSFDDIETHDPTYGLRPDEVRLPKKGQGFKGLKSLKRGMSTPGLGFGSGKYTNNSSSSSAFGFGLGSLLHEEARQQQEQQRREELHQQRLAQQQQAERRESIDIDAADRDEGRSEWASQDGIDEGQTAPARRRQHSSSAASSSGSSSGSSSSGGSSSSSSSLAQSVHEERSNLDYIDPFTEHFSDHTRFDYPQPSTAATTPRKSTTRSRRGSSKAASSTAGLDVKGKRKETRRSPAAPSSGAGLAGLNGLEGGRPSPLSRHASSGNSSTAGRIVQQHQRLPAIVAAASIADGPASAPASEPGGRRGREERTSHRPSPMRQMSTSSFGSVASSSAAAAAVRPRIFHSTSLIRPPDLTTDNTATEDYNSSSVAGSTYGYGRFLTTPGARSETASGSGGVPMMGGSSSTVIGGSGSGSGGAGGGGSATSGGGGAGGAGGNSSAAGSSRTFTIGRSGSYRRPNTAGSGSVASGSKITVRPEEYHGGARARDRARFGDDASGSKSGSDDVSSDDDDDDEEEMERPRRRRTNAHTEESISSPSDSNSTDDTSGRQGTTRLPARSKAGTLATLATLDPEPMSESGSAYKRDVWREKHSRGEGFYRPGYARGTGGGG